MLMNDERCAWCILYFQKQQQSVACFVVFWLNLKFFSSFVASFGVLKSWTSPKRGRKSQTTSMREATRNPKKIKNWLPMAIEERKTRLVIFSIKLYRHLHLRTQFTIYDRKTTSKIIQLLHHGDLSLVRLWCIPGVADRECQPIYVNPAHAENSSRQISSKNT